MNRRKRWALYVTSACIGAAFSLSMFDTMRFVLGEEVSLRHIGITCALMIAQFMLPQSVLPSHD